MGQMHFYRIGNEIDKKDLQAVLEMVVNNGAKLWHFDGDDWFDVSSLGKTAFTNGADRVLLAGTFRSINGTKRKFSYSDSGVPTSRELEMGYIEIINLCLSGDHVDHVLYDLSIKKRSGKLARGLDKKSRGELNDKWMALRTAIYFLAKEPEKCRVQNKVTGNSLARLVIKDELKYWRPGKPPGKTMLNELFKPILDGDMQEIYDLIKLHE